ncbi:MAG: hypothetical protein B7Z54_04345 [Sphingobacteriales bacterium 12-47-4]|nr:MAG: hypothetical protein B7Z54_04345 [Sphingobacteriales bacterium 12-47-4]
MKKIVIIGSGNVAAVLGRKFRAAGHIIIQVLSRNSMEASRLAYEWDTESANYLSLISQQGDVYVMAVSDQAIAELAKDLLLPDKVIAHTAASVNMNVLKDVSPHHGVFYPLQSLRKEMILLPEIPVFTEGATPKARQVLQELAASIAGEETRPSTMDERIRLHVAAVVVNNFTNHLYQLAEEYCRKENLDFRLLWPLIEETATRVKEISPSKSQTGPAIRGDEETIQKHLALLDNHPQLKEVYTFFSLQIKRQEA